MGKRKELSVEKARKTYGRNKEILGCIRGGWSTKKIAAEFCLSYSWAKKLCRRLKNGDNGERKSGSGRPRKTTPREDRYLVNEALKTRDSAEVCPTAGDLAKALWERSSTKISTATVQRRLRERNIKKCAKTKKPYVSAVNRRKRVEFARQHRNWTVEDWKRVLWSDESPYTISSHTRQYVWRTPQDKYSPRCLQGTVKHQKKIMVWGCFSWYGLGALYNIKGILKKEKYRQILIHQMRPSARRLQGNDFVFQHDNDPKHTSHLVKNYLQNQQIEVLPWPPQSPDLNPIENLWSELDRQTERKSCNSEEELFKQLKEQWVKLSPDYLKKLVESMPRRCEKVIKSRGYPIDY